MTLSQEILKALDEVERVKKKIGSSELARRARARVRKQLGTTLVKLTINDLLKVVKNRKELLGTSMGEMRKTVLQRVVPNERSKSLIFQGSAYGKKQYKPQITFYSVDFAMEKDKKHPLSASIKDGDVGTKILWVEQVKKDTHPVQCRCTCFVGDTLIPLLNGKSVKIKDLVGLDEFFVYSYDIEKKSIEVGRGHSCRKTGEKVPVVKVTFDNGQSVTCTEDHLFLQKNGEYEQVGKIKSTVSLMALYRRLSKGSLKDYELVLQGRGWQDREATHKISDRYNVENGLDLFEGSKFARHHKDFNKRNNEPSNICRLDFYKHIGYHRELAIKNVKKQLENGAHFSQNKELIEKNRTRMKTDNPMKDSKIVEKTVITSLMRNRDKQASTRMKIDNPMKDSATIARVAKTRRERGCNVGCGYNFRASDKDVREKMSISKIKAIKEGRFKPWENFGDVSKKLVEQGLHHFQTKEHSERVSKHQSLLAKDGSHPFQNLTHEQKTAYYYKQESGAKSYHVLQWLKSLSKNSIRVTKDLANSLGFSSIGTLSSSINKAIKNNKLDYISILTSMNKNIGTQVIVKDKNHKIISIEPAGFEDVYCFTVDKYENFAIDVENGKDCSSGVFVHNCKDFSFRWGWYDKDKKALSGPNTYSYTRKTPPPPEGYPYVNPGNYPGFCKHLYTLIELLQKRKLLI